MRKSLLELELTNICNAKCVMCPVHDMKRKRGFMNRATFELIIEKGIDYGIQRIRFCGLGEPLLHKNFCQYLSYIREHTDVITELITNGSLLSRDIVQCLVKNRIDFLSISFPSLRKRSYQKIMKGLVFDESLNRVLFAIDELRKNCNTHIKVTSIMTDFNSNEKMELEHFWSKKRIDSLELFTPHNRGGHLKDKGVLNIADDAETASKPGTLKSLCPWPLRNFFIAWDGSVFLCCCDMEGDCRAGDIDIDDFSRIERVQESICIAQPDLCEKCTYKKAKNLLKKDF